MITSVIPKKEYIVTEKTRLCVRILQCAKESLRERIGFNRLHYTFHLSRAEFSSFGERLPVTPMLGLPIQPIRARVKFWLGTDGAKSFTQQILSLQNQFFGTFTIFIRSLPKIFCRVNHLCKWAFTDKFLV